MARRVFTRLRALLRWLGLGSFSFATKWIGLSALIGLAAIASDGGAIGTVVAVENFGAGDVVEIEIEGLGRQRQEFVAWEAQR
jgi:hypothetical protein